MLQRDVDHSAIPVLFQIPYECRPTDERDLDNMLIWRLEVTAKTPGIDYRAEFEVPVFKTSESDPQFVVDRSLIAKYTVPEDPQCDLHDAGVIKTPSLGGDGWQFVFPMARRAGAALIVTGVGVVFCGAPFVWLCLDFQYIAIPFAIVFWLMGSAALIAAAVLWFYRSVADVNHRGVTVTGGLFGWGSSRWIAATEVERIDTESNMKSYKLMYYDLIIVCRDGNASRPASGCPAIVWRFPSPGR